MGLCDALPYLIRAFLESNKRQTINVLPTEQKK